MIEGSSASQSAFAAVASRPSSARREAQAAPPARGFAVALAAAKRVDKATTQPDSRDAATRDDLPPPGVRSAQSSAEVFNARGFFAHGVARGHATQGSQVGPTVSTEAAVATIASTAATTLTPAKSAAAKPAPGQTLPLMPHGTAPRGMPLVAHSARTVARTASVPAVAHPADFGIAVTGSPSLPEDPIAPATARVTPRSVPVARTSPVALTVHEVETGLRIVARVGDLDERERAALLDDIAALVARHGRPATDIAIVGHGAPRGPRQANS